MALKSMSRDNEKKDHMLHPGVHWDTEAPLWSMKSVHSLS